MIDLREQLADIEHERWSGWMRYLFSKCARTKDGLEIPEDSVVWWKGLIDTPYNELTEKTKDGDRKEVDKTLAVVQPYIDKQAERIAELEAALNIALNDPARCMGLCNDSRESITKALAGGE